MDTGDRTLARPRGTGRLQRVLKMLTRLQTGQFCNADELASVCGVSRRTIYRDIGALEAAGIGLYYDRKTGGYKVSSACFLPPVDLNITEALSIILLASELGGKGKWPLVGPACDAAAKIASNLPVGIRALVAQMLQRVKIRGQRFARHEHLEDIYEQLQKAIQHRHRVEVTYISFHEAKQIRTRLGPYWLLFHSRAWYVIGHSSLHKAVRTFKLGRIKSATHTNTRYTIPARMSLDDYLGSAWQMIREGKMHHVKLRFAPLVAPNVAEVNWHNSQRVAWHDDGSITFEVHVDGLKEIFWWILGYGEQVEVLAPKKLRMMVREAAQGMLRKYA